MRLALLVNSKAGPLDRSACEARAHEIQAAFKAVGVQSEIFLCEPARLTRTAQQLAGSGTIWGAYEIQDLILKCLAQGAKGHYSPDLTGHHPEDRNDQTTPENIAKMYRYSAGLGYVMRGHGFSALAFLPRLLRPLAGMVVYRLSGRSGMARRSAQILRGRIDGWRSAPNRHGSL